MSGKESRIFNVIFREKPALLLIELRNSKGEVYASSVAKKIDCTYSHVVKILQEFEGSNLVKFEKQGRLKLLTLTKKGTEVAELLSKVKNSLP
jgi:DNA-binding MarR family transcriptional regulator